MPTASKTQSKSKDAAKNAMDSVSRGSIITMGVASALVGLWAVACLVSTVAGSGGPIELIRTWFSAVSGV